MGNSLKLPVNENSIEENVYAQVATERARIPNYNPIDFDGDITIFDNELPPEDSLTKSRSFYVSENNNHNVISYNNEQHSNMEDSERFNNNDNSMKNYANKEVNSVTNYGKL